MFFSNILFNKTVFFNGGLKAIRMFPNKVLNVQCRLFTSFIQKTSKPCYAIRSIIRMLNVISVISNLYNTFTFPFHLVQSLLFF